MEQDQSKTKTPAAVRSSDGLGRPCRIATRTVKYLVVVLCVIAALMLVVFGVCTLLDKISKLLVPLLWIGGVTSLCALAAWAEECDRERKRNRPNTESSHTAGRKE